MCVCERENERQDMCLFSSHMCVCERGEKRVCVCCVVQACAYVSELYEQKDRGRDFEIKKCIK